MFLRKIKYKQFEGESRNWDLADVEFEKINLLVGKNSAGKSKTIAIINGLSVILGENAKLPFSNGCYDVVFENNSKSSIKFELNYHNNQIVKEKLMINDELFIQRDADGGGVVFTNARDSHQFKIPANELKVNRRDEIQYPYLEDLNFWANHVRAFFFNTHLGKDFLGYRDKSNKAELEFNLKATEKVVDTFNRGQKKYGKVYTDKIINDFNQIGYNITSIELGSLISVGLEVVDNPNIEIIGLKVQEKDLECMTDQTDMSMGMFRALSIIIHFNYYELENIPGCVLIDDIGEGLDYERSTELIKLLIAKVESKTSNIQLFMSTNDRFVMNSVDLKYWQVIDRVGSNVSYYNIKNSSQIFEDFKFTGLNNFDFFATDFFKTGFKTEN